MQRTLDNVDYGRDLNSIVIGCKHFRYRELVGSEVAVKYNIKNIPNEQQWQSLEALAQKVLEPIRAQFGAIKVLSAFRNVQLNTHSEIKGSKTSNHTRGIAADIVPLAPKVTRMQVLEWAYHNLDFWELIAERFDSKTKGWVHIAYNGTRRIAGLKILSQTSGGVKPIEMAQLQELYGESEVRHA